jgi:hypothetical protein
MLIEGTTLTLPGATEDKPDQTLDLGSILIAEGRQQEISFVTPIKSAELLYTFNKAWLDTDKLVKGLAADLVKAEKAVATRRSRILLYEVEPFLKQQGVPSTKESREAFIILDERYGVLQERVDQLYAAQEWLKGKMTAFTNSYTSVKKIMGEDTYNMSGRMNNPNLSGGGSQKPFLKQEPTTPTPTTTPPTKTTPSGYGKSRYT